MDRDHATSYSIPTSVVAKANIDYTDTFKSNLGRDLICIAELPYPLHSGYRRSNDDMMNRSTDNPMTTTDMNLTEVENDCLTRRILNHERVSRA